MRLSPSLSPHRTWSRHIYCLILGCSFVLIAQQFLTEFISSSATLKTHLPRGIFPVAAAWEWTDYVVGGNKNEESVDRRNTLSNAEISYLRVRDIKRRLARSHGYGASELARMLDKKDLIAALSKEETKLRIKHRGEQRRKLFWKAIFVTIMCVVAIIGWPLWVQLSEITAINCQVYYDRKRHEISQCVEFRSGKGAVGVMLLAILDGIRFWLSLTVLLSWVLPSESYYRRYMFPIPSISIRPAQFMGEKVASGPFGRYGMNIAPMAITWSIGFFRGRIEYWTGRALSAAAKLRRKEARSEETEEERRARKAAKKAAKRTAKEEQERRQQEMWVKETERRKEMAEKASDELFGGTNNGGRPQSQRTESKKQISTNNGYNDAKREFEEDMEGLDDMNHLD